MAYNQNNLRLTSGAPLTAAALTGAQEWVYTSTDTLATVCGVGYISNAVDMGIKLGDVIETHDNSVAATPVVTWLRVVGVGTTSCTLATTQTGTGSGNNEINTAITTVGAGTLTAAALTGGMITRTGPTVAYTDTTDTAALIIAAVSGGYTGQSWEVTIKNTTAFTATLAAGSGVTLSGQTIIPANSVLRALLTITSATAVTLVGQSITPMTTSVPEVFTALTTVGAGTILAASIAGGAVNRTGPTSAAVDTTDTAALIIAAVPNANVGQSWEFTYYNNSLGACTVTAGASVTVTGGIVPANMWVRFLATINTATTVTLVAVAAGPCVVLPVSKDSTNATATLIAGDISGANIVHFIATGANATVTTRTGAQMFGDIPNCQIGFAYTVFWRNTNATGNTITAADGSVTLTGTMTVAQNVTRMLSVKFTSITAVTITSMGIFAAAA